MVTIFAALSALTGASLPVLFAVLSGERPEMLTWVGISLALPAILLLSSEKGGKKDHVIKSLRLGFLAGCGFSGFFILIAQTGENSGMWPLLAARATTVPVFMLITLFQKKSFILAKFSLGYALFAGALDMGANIFYLFATRTGFMVTAVITSSLYPAPTVLLQRIVREEKLNFLRICSIILAITGAAIIGVGN